MTPLTFLREVIGLAAVSACCIAGSVWLHQLMEAIQ